MKRILEGHAREGPWLARLEGAAAVVATAAVVALHVRFLRNAGGLWRDEVNSLNLATLPSVADIWRLLEFDSFPLLWPLLVRGWAALFGPSDAALRLLGLASGLLVVGAIWFAARSFGPGVPVLSLALVAASPHVVRWGGTLRAYGLGAALLVIALALFARALARPARGTRLAAAVAAVLAVQCLFQSVPLLAAIGAGAVVAAVAARQWAGLVAPLVAGLAAVVSLLPYLGPVGRVAEWSMLLQGPLGMADIVAKLVAMLSAAGTVAALGWGAAWVLGIAMALHRRADPAALYAGTVTVVAPVAFTLFLLRLGYKTEPWYYVGLAVLVAVSAEAALWAARPPRWARWARLGLAAAIVAACLPAAWAALGERQTNVDVIAARLSTEARAGDVIVISPWFYALPFDRSYRGVAEVLTVPPLEDRRLHRYDLFKRRMLDPRCMAPVLESVEAALQRGHRVWIVGSVLTSRGQRPPVPPPPPLPGTGWNAGPYLASWMKQLGAVVERRARDVRPVIVPRGVVESESAALLVASGHVP